MCTRIFWVVQSTRRPVRERRLADSLLETGRRGRWHDGRPGAASRGVICHHLGARASTRAGKHPRAAVTPASVCLSTPRSVSVGVPSWTELIVQALSRKKNGPSVELVCSGASDGLAWVREDAARVRPRTSPLPCSATSPSEQLNNVVSSSACA